MPLLVVGPEAVRVDELDVDEAVAGSVCKEDSVPKDRDKRGSAAEPSQQICSCKIQ